MTRHFIVALLCAMLLSGCMATNLEQWSRSPDDARLKRDLYECKADADAVSYRATAFGGAIMPIVGLFERRSTFNECMGARGWKRSGD